MAAVAATMPAAGPAHPTAIAADADFGRDLGFVIGHFLRVDLPIPVAVERCEKAGGVGAELGAGEHAVMVGVGAVEPAAYLCLASPRAPERLAHRAEEQAEARGRPGGPIRSGMPAVPRRPGFASGERDQDRAGDERDGEAMHKRPYRK